MMASAGAAGSNFIDLAPAVWGASYSETRSPVRGFAESAV